MALSQAETDRAGALAILEANGASPVEALTYLGLADRDGRARAKGGLSVVAGEDQDHYIVFWPAE